MVHPISRTPRMDADTTGLRVGFCFISFQALTASKPLTNYTSSIKSSLSMNSVFKPVDSNILAPTTLQSSIAVTHLGPPHTD